MNEQNERLEKLEPRLTIVEAFGARLYTGPLFVKYNAVLRGLDSDVDFLRNDMMPNAARNMLRGGTWEAPQWARRPTASCRTCKRSTRPTRTRRRFMQSTAPSSGSAMTVAGKVYRGVSGRAAGQVLEGNDFGVRGGIEGGFMSTTEDRQVAMSYAASGAASFVFEIQQGMIDRGADIGWLSQYHTSARFSLRR